MSSEWPLVRLGNYVDSCLGKMLDAKKNKGTPQPYLGNSNVRWGEFDLADLAEMKFEAHEEKRYSLLPGDLVVCEGGEPGRCAIWSGSPGMKIQKALHRIRPKEKLDNYYLFYWFRHAAKTGLLDAHVTGTTIKHLTGKAIAALEVPLPPVVVQRSMVDVLRGLDDRITLLRETNATLEAIAQALFKSWFIDFDPVRANASRSPRPLGEGLGVRATAPLAADPHPSPLPAGEGVATLFPDDFEDTELGPVPKGWSISTLGAICDAHAGAIQTGPFGSQLHASDYVDEGIPVVMPKDIFQRRVNADTAARIPVEEAQRLSRHRLQKGDIVFSRRGDVEKHALIGDTEYGWLCGTGCLLVRPGKQWGSPSFLSRALDLPRTKQWLKQHAVGATMPNLNTGILSSVPVLLPNRHVLSAFEEITNPLDERISANNAKAQTLATLRDTMLPRLISGQLRLPEAEALLEQKSA